MDTYNRKKLSPSGSPIFRHGSLEPSLSSLIQHELSPKLRSLLSQLVRLLVPRIPLVSPHMMHCHLPTGVTVKLPEPTKNQSPNVCVAHPLATCRPPPLPFPSRQPTVQTKCLAPCPLVLAVAYVFACNVAVRENPHQRSDRMSA